MGEMRALCVSSPNNVKYEFSCMLTEESCKLSTQQRCVYSQDDSQAAERSLSPLATMTCGGVSQRVYCAQWRVRTVWNHLGIGCYGDKVRSNQLRFTCPTRQRCFYQSHVAGQVGRCYSAPHGNHGQGAYGCGYGPSSTALGGERTDRREPWRGQLPDGHG